MHYVFRCFDKPDAGAVRMANRPAHLEYLAANEARIVAAGAMLDDDGATVIGSLLIVDCADRAAADAFAAGDPYAVAGLFARVEIFPWRKVYPKG